MRGYFLTNMYLSPIQHGIQSAHCLQEINNKYQNRPADHIQLLDWATNHKTMYVLNGGTSDQMKQILELFKWESNPYPWAYFNEPSIDDALTCVGIIIPEEVYKNDHDFGTFDYELSSMLRSKRFAR